eukprot:6173567-Pleurochrysis_carterae.AAC.5
MPAEEGAGAPELELPIAPRPGRLPTMALCAEMPFGAEWPLLAMAERPLRPAGPMPPFAPSAPIEPVADIGPDIGPDIESAAIAGARAETAGPALDGGSDDGSATAAGGGDRWPLAWRSSDGHSHDEVPVMLL